MNDKKYQVFISSTFNDLKEARQYVLQGILKLNHIPNGMELFPASNISSWDFIKKVIDSCDYYILFIGNKYDSISSDGISFTEREYNYAVEKELPVIAFINTDEDSGKSKVELDSEKIEKLKKFKEKIKNAGNVQFWKGLSELQVKVNTSFISLIETNPTTGWIRGDQQIGLESQKEILRLKQVIRFENGEDKILIHFEFIANAADSRQYKCKSSFYSTWNNVFKLIAPSLLVEGSEIKIKNKINEYIHSEQHEITKKEEEFKKFSTLLDYRITEKSYEILLIQYMALDYIITSSKKHSLRDRNKYYSLTDLGEDLMVELSAIKKPWVKFEEMGITPLEIETLVDLEKIIGGELDIWFDDPNDPDDLGYHGFQIKNERIVRLAVGSGQNSMAIPNSISNLKDIEKLSIYESSSENIESIGTLTKLQRLDIFAIKLKAIPEAIFQLKNLRHLDVFGCNLEEISPSIISLENLEKLSLYDNKIETILQEIGRLKKLEFVDFSRNLISEVPNVFGELSCLKTLSLTNNPISQIPSFLFELNSLEELNIGSAELEKLPDDIKVNNSIKNLSIWKSKLSGLPEWITKLKNLHTLSLNHNAFKKIPDIIFKLDKLKVLALGGQSIKVLPDNISLLKNLEELSIEIENFTNLSEKIHDLPNLKKIITGKIEKEIPPKITDLIEKLKKKGIIVKENSYS